MNFYTEFEQALIECTFLACPEIPKEAIFFMYGGVPEPKSDYLAILIKSLDKTGMAYQGTLADLDETLLVRTEYRARVQFLFVGQKSASLSSDFIQAISHVATWEEFGKRNLSIITISPNQFQPDKRNTGWRSRHSVELEIGAAAETREKVAVIERVIITDLKGNRIAIPQ